ALSRREGATPFMTFLAAWGVLLGRTAHQEDLLVGTPIANRTHRELEPLIGFFVNTLVLRLDLAGAPSFRQLLGRGRPAPGRAPSPPGPLRSAPRAAGRPRAPAPPRPPPSRGCFPPHNPPAAPGALPSLVTRPFEIPAATSKFDLSLDLAVGGERIDGGVEY